MLSLCFTMLIAYKMSSVGVPRLNATVCGCKRIMKELKMHRNELFIKINFYLFTALCLEKEKGKNYR